MELTRTTYRRSIVLSAALSTGLYLAGCTHQTVVVKEQDLSKAGVPATELQGIPFYSKKGVCNKESVWLEPQYTLQITIVADGEAPMTRTMVLSRAGYLGADTEVLLQTLTGLKGSYRLSEIVPASCPSAIGVKWEPISANPQYSVTPNLDSNAALLQQAESSQNVVLISNAAEVGAAVDYTHRDYLNTVSPWNGSSQVDAKLAADGTLTEGSVQRDDETLSTVLTSITSLVGDFTGASTATAVAAAPAAVTPNGIEPQAAHPSGGTPRASCPAYRSWPGAIKVVKYTYSLKTVVYRHDHKEQSDLSGKCSLLGDRVWGGNFVVSVEDGSGSDKKSGKAIEFSGQIKLPESSGKKTDDRDSSKD
jgi:hypothetical protein